MILPEGVHQLKTFAQFPGKACRIVPVDGQSAAFFRTVEGKGPDDDMAAAPDRLLQARQIGRSVGGIHQEMEGGPVMPDVAGGQLRDPADVAHNPMDLIGSIPQSGFGVFERDLRNVEDSHVLEASGHEAVHKS